MTRAVSIAQSGSNNVTMRNRIINGAMMIDARNAGASVTPASGTYTLDRWSYQASQASKFTVQQTPSATETGYATRVAAGFTNYLACTVASSVSIGSSDYFYLRQPVEGFNFADMAWGTANAKSVTLSFMAYSSLTGTFGGAIFNAATNRSYPFSYSIPTANTWTQISITIAGDTTGTWVGATNGVGAYVNFGLGIGSTFSGTANTWAGSLYVAPTGATSVVGTAGATFYITGVQLEAGTTATPFEQRLYGTELILCQRYYQAVYGSASGNPLLTRINAVYVGSGIFLNYYQKVSMRAAPTVAVTGTWSTQNCGTPTANASTTEIVTISSNATISGDTYFFAPSSTAGITMSAEL